MILHDLTFQIFRPSAQVPKGALKGALKGATKLCQELQGPATLPWSHHQASATQQAGSLQLIYADSRSDGAIVCYCMLLYAIVCYCMLLYAIVCYCMLLYAIVCYCMLLYAIVCYCMLLYAIVCYCMLLCYHYMRIDT